MDDYAPYYSNGSSGLYGNYYNYSNYYGMGYNSIYGNNSRTAEMTQWDLSVDTKFYFGRSKRFMPYLGAGLSFSRFNLNYDEESMYNWNGYNNGDESTTGSYLSGLVVTGTDINFTDTLGMKLELSYSKGFTGVLGENSNTYTFNPDQEKLQALGEEVSNGHSFGINAGMLIKF